MQANEARKLSDEAEKSRWRMACRKEKNDRDSEEKRQRILAKEIIKELPSKIEKVAKEGKTVLRFAHVPYHVKIPGITELNVLNIGSIRKYFCSSYNSRILEYRRMHFFHNSTRWLLSHDDGVLMARIVSSWLLRNGFRIRIEKERDHLGNTTRKWLAAIW